jgi:hypothetical protein
VVSTHVEPEPLYPCRRSTGPSWSRSIAWKASLPFAPSSDAVLGCACRHMRVMLPHSGACSAAYSRASVVVGSAGYGAMVASGT